MIVDVLLVWAGGLLLAAHTLWMYGLVRSNPERLLSVLGLVFWVMACMVLALLVTVWWLPT